jgi:hypothetical protein
LIFLWHEVSGWNNWHNSHGPFWESINAWKSKLHCGMWLQTSLWTFQLYGTGDYSSWYHYKALPFSLPTPFHPTLMKLILYRFSRVTLLWVMPVFPMELMVISSFICHLFIFMCTTGKPCYSETSSYIDFTHPLIYCIL